ncbi:hypothetical protein I3843_12G029100 [Carya illinoinensis]|nr:hypothetical protein I3760_12G029100 [Carya illinoinensis]KAG7951856.1 hypothetical protein I3843_12G029100 [Carya illinoinensis]
MRSSEFMDKQIMELSRSRSDDFLTLSTNPEDDEDNGDHSPVFRFHPIRPVAPPQSHTSSFGFEKFGAGSNHNAGDSHGSALISVIDRMMEEFIKNLVHAVEGLSARLSQLETRMHRLENSTDDLKETFELNQSSSDLKLRQLEITLKEVQDGIQDLRDKQEIVEAQQQLAKLKMAKDTQRLEMQNSTLQSNQPQGVISSVPQQSHQSLSIPVACPQQPPSLPYSVVQNQPFQNTSPLLTSSVPAGQIPTQLSQNQIPLLPRPEFYYSSPVLTPESTHQQYPMPPMKQSQQPSSAPQQHYHPAPQLQPISQLPQPPHELHPHLTFGNSQAYYPSTHYAPASAPPSQKFYLGSAQQMHHDQPPSNPYSGSPSRHSTFYEHSYGGAPSQYSSSTMKPTQSPSSPPVLGGESSKTRPPTAQVLPHALPMASNVVAETGSSGTRDRITTDDVVDKVVAMGFRRDLVRATVRKLTETGQAADLNIVLDMLMNSGEVGPHGGRFG